ncbi:hypothetical protein EI555_004583 [Monodon monoceros]|uniref:ORM1-like protein n=19 Tax=Eutheria TaxID=9347 RepID=A0A4U1FRB8_MONMO|nr:hypothetical protein EI555_004583 [Monodon monoceros]
MGGGDADSASPIGRAQMGRGCCLLETAGVEASAAPPPKLDWLPKLAEIKLDSCLIPRCGRMNVGVAHSEVNPNTRVMNSRGIWLAYIILVGLLHVVLLSIPFFSIPVVWTLTNVIHNLAMYVFLHTVKGTPFETPDQGKARLLTHWEQMDYGLQFTSSRKFLSISPIVLYLLASFYTKYDAAHFLINTASLLSVLLPKLPQFHGVRLFGINKY